MWQVILLVAGVVMATIGTVMIYDARILTKRFFSFGDQNDASLGLKILGFLIAIGGALLVFFQF
ncbi:unknown [Clostridium sp. CAG:273]|nr:unknown [Clostridium sp. CAG:273]